LQNGVLDVMEDACNGLLSNILSEKMGEIEQPQGAIAAASKAAAVSAQLSANNGAYFCRIIVGLICQTRGRVFVRSRNVCSPAACAAWG
jgi:hypothetical protein